MFTPITARCDAPPQLREPLRGRLGAAVVEAHPVDDGAVGDEPEQARPRIAVLRDRRDRAHLDVPEAERVEPAGGAHVLVEPGRDAERRLEAQSERRRSAARARDG